MFRSSFGGIITLFLVFGATIYFSIRTNVLLNYGQTTSKQNGFLVSSHENTNQMSFKDNEFFFSVTIQDFKETSFFIDKKYGEFKSFLLVTEKAESGSTKPRTVTPIYFNLSICANSSLPQNQISKSEFINNYNLSNYLCPEADFYLQGQSFSDRQVRPFIYYEECHDHDYCANETEKEYFYKQAIVNILIGDRWFDPNNYTTPLQAYFQSELKPIREDSLSILQLYIQNNTVRLKDSFLGLYTEEFDFLKVDSKFNFVADKRGGGFQRKNTPYEVFRIVLQLSHEKIVYERSVYTINNLMADVGGFFNSILFVGATIYYTFQQQLLFTSLLPKAYYSFRSEKIKVHVDSERMISGFEIGSSQFSKACQGIKRSNTQYENILNFVSLIKAHKKLRKCIVAKLTLKKMFGCFCKKALSKIQTYHFYDHGKQKLLQELDLINYLRKLRKVEVLYSLLFDPQIQVLGNIAGAIIHKEDNKNKTQLSNLDGIDEIKSYLKDNFNYYKRNSQKKRLKKLIQIILQSEDQEEEEQSEVNIFEQSRPMDQDIQQLPGSSLRLNQTLELTTQNIKQQRENSVHSKIKARTRFKRKNR